MKSFMEKLLQTKECKISIFGNFHDRGSDASQAALLTTRWWCGKGKPNQKESLEKRFDLVC